MIRQSQQMMSFSRTIET